MKVARAENPASEVSQVGEATVRVARLPFVGLYWGSVEWEGGKEFYAHADRAKLVQDVKFFASLLGGRACD